MKPSSRSDIAPFYVMEVMRAAEVREAAGGEVLHLEVGQPSTPAPAGALAAVAEALNTDKLGYTGAAGLPALRSAISRWYRDRYDTDVPTERIVVTTGASGSCVLGFLALFDAGDRVAVLEPGYPCYRNDLMALGVEVVTVAVGHETEFRPTIEQLDRLGQLDGLIIASPSNPTGTVLSADILAAVVDWAESNDVRLIVDEIYHGIAYDVATPTALAYGDQVTVIGSFSKYFSMTGWRVGWIVAPPGIVDDIGLVNISNVVCNVGIAQDAAIQALAAPDSDLREASARWQGRRDVLLEELDGYPIIAPHGGWSLLLDMAPMSLNGAEASQRLMEHGKVAATPMDGWGTERSAGFLRLVFSNEPAERLRGIRRRFEAALGSPAAEG